MKVKSVEEKIEICYNMFVIENKICFKNFSIETRFFLLTHNCWYANILKICAKIEKGREKHMKKCLTSGYMYKVNSCEDLMFLSLFEPGIIVA